MVGPPDGTLRRSQSALDGYRLCNRGASPSLGASDITAEQHPPDPWARRLRLAIEIGWRYARSRRSYIAFVSIVAVAGLALSVAVLIVVTSVINGFERELTQRVLGVLPHVTLVARRPAPVDAELVDRLKSTPGVTSVDAFVQAAALLATPRATAGVVMTGLDPHSAAAARLDAYAAEHLSEVLVPGGFRAAVGQAIARDLGLSVGDPVTVVLPDVTITPVGVFPRQKQFIVAAILNTRSEIDARHVIVHLQDAGRLLRLGARVQGYQLQVDDLFRAGQVAQEALNAAGRVAYFARTWLQTQGSLYQAIALQKVIMFVLLSFLVAVAAFNLVSTLVLVVSERRADVAVLRTLGGSGQIVVVTFVTLGALIGVVGIAIGLGAGVALSLVLPDVFVTVNGLLDRELMSQYFINDLPVEVRISDVVGILSVALVLAVLSTVYPAIRAARLSPARVLAHE